MKTPKHTIRHRFLQSLALSLLLATPALLPAADDILIDNFDTSDGASQWARWWGNAVQTYEWDGAVDADTNAASGSLKVTIQFDLAAHTGENQFAALRTFNTVDGSQYTNLVFDLRWDQASPRRAGGDFGYLEPGFRNQDFSQNWLPGFPVSTNEGWQRIVLPINPNAPKIDAINGVVLKMWSGDPASGFTGPAVFWVDNVRLIARTDTEVPPPTLSLEPAKPGLRIFASAPGVQYQRQSIRTVSPNYSWVGATEPVTYAVTIADYPANIYSGFQTHVFLVPGNALPTWETSPDWNQPNLIFLQIQNNADGSAYAAFRYKTNLPSGNSMLFGSGMIAGLGAPQVRGEWSLTFDPSGSIALSAPNGAVTNFALPTEAVALFGGSLYAYFGAQPNQLTSIGQSATFGRLRISGVSSPIDESFTSPTLDSSRWEIIAEDANGVVTVPPDAMFWLNWSLPDRGFGLQTIDDLELAEAGIWLEFSPLVVGQVGSQRRALVLPSHLPPSLSKGFFFRMYKTQ